MDRTKPVVVKLEGSEKYQRLLPGAPVTCGMKSGHVCLKPGESVGQHSTDSREEAIVILEGCAQIIAGGVVSATAAAGQMVYIPPHTDHDLRNSGNGVLRYVYVVSPVVLSP